MINTFFLQHLHSWLSTHFSRASKSEIFIHRGKAIRGYDVVAFFDESKMKPGSCHYTYVWKEALWLFSTSYNRDLFASSPEKYEPQYGGFCAFGVARGYKAQTDLGTWVILEQKLYLSYSKEVKAGWEANLVSLIKQADSQWMRVKAKATQYTLPLLTLASAIFQWSGFNF